MPKRGLQNNPFWEPWRDPRARGARGQGMLRAPDEVQNPMGEVFLDMGIAGESIEENGEVRILGNQLRELSFLSRNVSKTRQT